MARFLRNTDLRTTWDQAFPEVMQACAERRADGVWIVPEMIGAYTELHAQGHAHSVEVWRRDELIGGIYGVHRGGLFAGESMFHRVDNASKLAFIELVRTLHAHGIELLDVQILTDHLASLGAKNIPRQDYLATLGNLRHKETLPF
jgi:leucyl/phenylalanyl-tRNA--protein transferase